MGDVITKFTSDVTQLQKAYDKLEAENRKLLQRQEELKGKSKESSDTHVAGLQATIANVAKLAAGYLTVSSAIGLVAQAERERREANEKSLTTQMSLADAQRDALLNLGKASRQEQAQFIQGVEQIASQRKANLADVYAGAGGALASNAQEGTAGAMANLDLAFRVARGEGASELAGALGKVSAATGVSNPLENLDLINTMGSQTEIKDQKLIYRNLPGALAGLVTAGDSPAFAASLLTATTKMVHDVTGESTGRQLQDLAKQLEEAFPESNRFVGGKLAARGTGLTSMEERLNHLRENPKLIEKFLNEEGHFSSNFVFKMRELIRGGEIAQLQKRFQGEYLSGAAAERSAEGFIASLDAPALQQVANKVRGGQGVLERARVNDIEGALEADIYENRAEHMQRMGIGFVERQIQKGLLDWWSGNTPEEFAAIAEAQEKQLAGRLAMPNPLGFDTSAMQRQLEYTRSLLEELRGMRADARSRVPATEQHTE